MVSSMRKNITSVLLAVMILSLTACAQGNTSGSGESTTSSADTSAHSTADTSVSESYPETSSNESTPDTSVSESTPDTSVSEVTTADTTVSESDPEDIPEVWNPAVIQRQVMLDEGYMCGVAYLGYVDGEADISSLSEISPTRM